VRAGNRTILKKSRPAFFFREQPVISTQGNKQLARWDLEGFTTWPQAAETIRIVRSHETKITRQHSETSDWFWLTTLDQKQASTDTICRIGHARWDIENQGFNYLVNYLAFDHCFHHHPNAILAFCLINFIAYILLQTFHRFNLKPQLRKKLHLPALIHELAASFWNHLPALNPKPRAPPDL